MTTRKRARQTFFELALANANSITTSSTERPVKRRRVYEKVRCHCGCGQMVSSKTVKRHIQKEGTWRSSSRHSFTDESSDAGMDLASYTLGQSSSPVAEVDEDEERERLNVGDEDDVDHGSTVIPPSFEDLNLSDGAGWSQLVEDKEVSEEDGPLAIDKVDGFALSQLSIEPPTMTNSLSFHTSPEGCNEDLPSLSKDVINPNALSADPTPPGDLINTPSSPKYDPISSFEIPSQPMSSEDESKPIDLRAKLVEADSDKYLLPNEAYLEFDAVYILNDYAKQLASMGEMNEYYAGDNKDDDDPYWPDPIELDGLFGRDGDGESQSKDDNGEAPVPNYREHNVDDEGTPELTDSNMTIDTEGTSDLLNSDHSRLKWSLNDGERKGWDRSLYKETGVLTARDILSTEFERKRAALGLRLTEEELKAVRAFNFKVATHQVEETFAKLPRAFPQLLDDWKSLDVLENLMVKLSGLQIQLVDCCPNSCHAFTGVYKDRDTCTYCGKNRYDSDGKPLKTFQYIPVTPRFIAEYRNIDRIEKFTYRAEFQHRKGHISDIFDSNCYQTLLQQRVKVDDSEYDRFYFSDDRDIALGFSTDGFCPFKRRKQTCWPLLAFNYNLPPSERFHIENLIPLGTIPGPRQMKDINSFLQPFVNEMKDLAKGVKVFDARAGEFFILRSYVISCFGDIPAVAKIMNMKGHNALYPCRACKIVGITPAESEPGSRYSKTLYVPLYREKGKSYDPVNLPMRNHSEFIRQATAVQDADTATEFQELSKRTGIKGIPILSQLPTLRFPDSFPIDFMHAVFENVIPQLVDLWRCEYKEFDSGVEEYKLAPSVLSAIGEAVKVSARTIPSFYGCKVPNPFTERFEYTAEAWTMWTLLLGPIVLRQRFSKDRYYVHFIKLVRLINICLKYEITEVELNDLEAGLASWVVEFEQIYIQQNMQRIPIATLPIHSLLHLAHYIRQNGPVWCSWAYPMERYCGSLVPIGGRSKRKVFKSIDKRERELEQLRMVKLIFNMVGELDLNRPPSLNSFIPLEVDDNITLLTSPQKTLQFSPALRLLIRQHLSIKLDLEERYFERFITEKMPCYGKLRWEGGATVHARDVVSTVGRDMSYIKYMVIEDANARFHNREIIWHRRTTYGQLLRLVQFNIVTTQGEDVREIVLAIVRPCRLKVSSLHSNLITTISTDGTFGALHVVNVEDIIGLAARVWDRGLEYFIEQPGSLDFFKDSLHVEEIT